MCARTRRTLAYLEAEFETDLSCYQTRDPATGQPSPPIPSPAALRDGQREVLLWLRHEIAQHRNNNQRQNKQNKIMNTALHNPYTRLCRAEVDEFSRRRGQGCRSGSN